MACVVVTFSSHAFAKLFESLYDVNAVEIVAKATQPFEALGYTNSRIRMHPRSLATPTRWFRLRDYLQAHDITQGTKRERSFRHIYGDDFGRLKREWFGFIMHFRMKAREGYFSTLEGLDEWVAHYNDSGKLLGYPTMGKSPRQMIAEAQTAVAASP